MTALSIDLIVRASVLLATAAAADLALRRTASAATRHLVWSLAVAALLVLPLGLSALPRWQVSVPIARAASSSVLSSARAIVADAVADRSSDAPPAASSPATTTSVTRVSIVTVLAFVYLTGLVTLLARLLRQPLAIRRLERASIDIDDPPWRERLDDCARRLGIIQPIRLLRCAHDVMPMTFGTRTATILLPASADAWPTDRREAVLLHELAHVARRDCLVQGAAAVACALYWPHPGVWWAAHRLRIERELACDDRVLAAGAPARDYAGHLLDLAHSLGRTAVPATALGMARARRIEQRLLAILDAARNRGVLHRRGVAAAIVVSIAVFVPMAALRAALVPTDDAAAAAPAFAAFAETSGQELTGTWDVRPTDDPRMVQVEVRNGRSRHGRTVARAQLEALTGTKISGNGPVHFPIRREAGTFTVDGVCRNDACAGTFGFQADPAFAESLARRGIGRPTPLEQFSLAIADVGAAYLDALAAGGYAKPDIQTLVRAAQHGVDLGYLRDMTGLGYKFGALDELITLRDHGVDPSYVRGMTASGYKNLTSDQLLRARDHGVGPEYVRGMKDAGFGGLALDSLIEARDHGVGPEYARDMAALGYKQSLDDLIRMRDHGVGPEYARDMAALGYKGVSMDDLVRMRDHGVDPEYVRRVQRRGDGRLSVDEIIHRRDRGGD